VNPYVSFALAMCAIVFLALFATSYMAVYFNRRAKADLLSALTPLALELNGQVEIDEATAAGVFRGHLSSGKVANIGRGPGRVFETRLVDGAGGNRWKWTATWPKIGLDSSATETSFESADASLELALSSINTELTGELLKAPGWLQFQYDPEAGNIMMTTPMRTRRDIPTQPVFHDWLEALYRLADVNRSAQARGSAPE
jgi:hypothetical protein